MALVTIKQECNKLKSKETLGVLLGVVVAGGVGAYFLTKVHAMPSGMSVSTDRTTYNPGDTISFTGTGASPSGTVVPCITLDDASEVLCDTTQAVTANSFGSFTGTYVVPFPSGGGDETSQYGIPPGPQNFVVMDETSGKTASAAVTIGSISAPQSPST